MPSLSYAGLVYLDQLGGIIEVFDIVPFIPLGTVPGPAYEILDGQTFTFSYCVFVKKAINLEGLVFVSVTLYKHQEELLWMGAVERILGWVRSRLQLSHGENRVDFLVTRYPEFVGQLTCLLDDLGEANVLLG